MSRAWMPLYVGDYIADTAHLTAAENGAYLLLMMHYWANAGLPSDERQIARIARMSPAEWKRSRDTLQAFFVDGWKHKRIEFELTKAARQSEQAAEAGRASAAARNARSTDVEQTSNERSTKQATERQRLQSQPQKEEEKETETVEQNYSHRAVASATRTAQAQWFEDFWKVFPRRRGANPRHPAEQKFTRLVGSDDQLAAKIIVGAGLYAKEIRELGKEKTEFVAQAIVWLNQRRWQDYADIPPEPTAEIGFHADAESEQLAAWDDYHRVKDGKPYPRNAAGGWRFPTEWPPGYVPKEKAA